MQVMNDMLKHGSLEDITIKTIAQEAGITRSTFYTHYQDKYALFGDVISDLFQEMYDNLNLPLSTTIEEVRTSYSTAYTQILTTLYNNRHIFNQTDNKVRQQVMLKSINVVKQDYIEQLKKLGFADTPALDYRANFFLNGLFFTYDHWIKQNYDIDIDELSQYLTDLTLSLMTNTTEKL